VITELSLSQFRNIQKSVLYPASGINLLVGENGSGKTSILEAIYLLAMGRSFRTRNLKNVIQTEQKQSQLFARIHPGIPVGMQVSSILGIQIRLNNAPLKKLSDLASHLPLQYIPANCHQFFDLGPGFRRKVIDWGLFHVEQEFMFHWQAYKKILSQRNAALRNSKPINEVRVWDSSLIEHGLKIASYRSHYLTNLLVEFIKWFNMLCDDYSSAKYEIRYSAGWPKDSQFAEVLHTTISRDCALGYTRSGPHAADWSIKINGQDPAEMCSRGQQKMFFLAISLAQISLLQEKTQGKSVLLIDDISSELDAEHQEVAMKTIKNLNIQSFITSTNPELNSSINTEEKDRMFHVKRGEINQV
jgi:DNA replication and repair protein RecF